MEIEQFQPTWRGKFEDEKRSLTAVFGEKALEIEHIGSTAILDLPSKPIIDIAMMIATHEDADGFTDGLCQLGYEYYPSTLWNIPPDRAERHFYTKGDPIEYHLSVAYADRGGFWRRQILFRDYLRAHPESRDEYAKLKVDLMRQHQYQRPSQSSGSGYSAGKTDFVHGILDLAGWKKGQKDRD